MRRWTFLRQTLFVAVCLFGLALSGGNPSPASADASPTKSRTLGIVLYPKFELLDVFGPAEIFGNLGPKLKVVMVAAAAGPVASVQGPKVVADYGFDDCPALDLVLVPGGIGTLAQLKEQ